MKKRKTLQEVARSLRHIPTVGELAKKAGVTRQAIYQARCAGKVLAYPDRFVLAK
jgi:hypothetical protein